MLVLSPVVLASYLEDYLKNPDLGDYPAAVKVLMIIKELCFQDDHPVFVIRRRFQYRILLALGEVIELLDACGELDLADELDIAIFDSVVPYFMYGTGPCAFD